MIAKTHDEVKNPLRKLSRAKEITNSAGIQLKFFFRKWNTSLGWVSKFKLKWRPKSHIVVIVNLRGKANSAYACPLLSLDGGE